MTVDCFVRLLSTRDKTKIRRCVAFCSLMKSCAGIVMYHSFFDVFHDKVFNYRYRLNTFSIFQREWVSCWRFW